MPDTVKAVGLPKTTKCAIDKLPEVVRRKVLDAILQGKTLREVAQIGGVSHEAVRIYKQRTVMPAIQKAQRIQALDSLDKPLPVRVANETTLTKDIVQASPFRERLEFLWQKTGKAIERAESAVRTVTDSETGKLVAVGPDVSAIAPLLNQAHKNVELLGRVTGELETSAGANVAIQIVMPSAAVAKPETPAAPVIDIAVVKR